MNELQKELQELNEKVADLESRIVAEPVSKWQPKGGYYCVHADGYVRQSHSTKGFRLNGVERETKEQAQRASIEMRRFNRLLALRDELCGDELVDWGVSTEKFIIYFNHHQSKWMFARYESRQHVTVHFVDLESAQKACDMINSGEVELC